MKSIKMSLIAVALFASFGASAQSARATNSDGYLTDSWGHVVKNSTGLCVRTSSYNPSVTFHPECDTVAAVEPTIVPRAADTVTPITPVAPVVQNVTKNLQAEVLFGFDSDKLSAAGKSRLDQLFQELKSSTGFNVNDVIITGHTDPIGTDSYNMNLSQRRANTVQQYLSGMLAKEVSRTVAKGESDLKVTTCGDKKTAKSIACNAPNRRVQVIINGTQTR